MNKILGKPNAAEQQGNMMRKRWRSRRRRRSRRRGVKRGKNGIFYVNKILFIFSFYSMRYDAVWLYWCGNCGRWLRHTCNSHAAALVRQIVCTVADCFRFVSQFRTNAMWSIILGLPYTASNQLIFINIQINSNLLDVPMIGLLPSCASRFPI